MPGSTRWSNVSPAEKGTPFFTSTIGWRISKRDGNAVGKRSITRAPMPPSGACANWVWSLTWKNRSLKQLFDRVIGFAQADEPVAQFVQGATRLLEPIGQRMEDPVQVVLAGQSV